VPDDNNNRTTNEWLRVIHTENEKSHRFLAEQLSKKADKEDIDKLEDRVDRVETKAHNQAIKLTSIATTVALMVTGAVLWVKGALFGN